MAKNFRPFKITASKDYLILICALLVFSSCDSVMRKTNYHRYSVGRMRIENPVIVEFAHDDDEYVDFYTRVNSCYVCADSISDYCLQDGWTEREDVFPYIRAALSCNEYVSNTHYNNRIRALAELFDTNYRPCTILYTKEENGVIINIHKFYYNLEDFDAYMQTYGPEYWADHTEEDIIYTHESDSINQYSTSNHTNAPKKAYLYRLALRHHYSLWQILKLRYKEWLLTMELEDVTSARYGEE